MGSPSPFYSAQKKRQHLSGAAAPVFYALNISFSFLKKPLRFS